MNPKPNEIKEARRNAGLTQKNAASLIGYHLRAWQMWEKGDRVMRRLLFDVWLQKLKENNERYR